MGMDSFRTGAQKRRGTYLNAVLTANAVLLGLVLLGNAPSARNAGGSVESLAAAGPPVEDESGNGRVSPAEQRKQIISELQGISAKFAALDARLKGPLTVKVVEMPKENAKDAKTPK